MRRDRNGVLRGGPRDRPITEMTREEMLWDLRTRAEAIHRSIIWRCRQPWGYRPSARDADANSLPAMSVAEFWDTCNKSVPVYILPCPKWELLRVVLHNYTYRRWFRPYRSEIDYYRFICKVIFPQELPTEPSVSQSTIRSIICLNKAICDEVEARRTSYIEHRALGLEVLPEGSRVPEERPHILQPLFRALLIVVSGENYKNEDSAAVGRLVVDLVRTGVEEGLCAPITFEPIKAKIIRHKEPGSVVQVTLETAIDFVMDLEAREAAAFGLRPDPVAAWEPDKMEIEWWQELGETEPLVGPSFRWVDTEKYTEWSGNSQKDDAHYFTGIERIQFRIDAILEARREAYRESKCTAAISNSNLIDSSPTTDSTPGGD